MKKTILAGMSEDGEMPVTAWLPHLPEITVEVRDNTYFAGSDGYVWMASYDAKANFENDVRVGAQKSILVENARWNTIEAIGPVVPDAVIAVEEAIAAALTILSAMDVDAADEAFA